MEPGLAGGGAEITVVADAGEAFWQDMQQPPADELVDEERHHGGLAGGAGGPTQKDVSRLVITNQALGGEGAALDVAGEVAQRGAAAAGVLDFDVPVFRG